METVLKVTGMSCGGCVESVKKVLQRVAGDQSARVDLGSGTAMVRHDTSVATDALIRAVIAAGFGAEQSVSPLQ